MMNESKTAPHSSLHADNNLKFTCRCMWAILWSPN